MKFTELLVQEMQKERRPISAKELSKKFRTPVTRVQIAISQIMSPTNNKWRSRNIEILARRKGLRGNITYELTTKNSPLHILKDNMDYQKKRCLHHIRRETTLTVVSASLKEDDLSKKQLLQQLIKHKNEISLQMSELESTQEAIEQQILNSI